MTVMWLHVLILTMQERHLNVLFDLCLQSRSRCGFDVVGIAYSHTVDKISLFVEGQSLSSLIS